jgi:phenylacetate-CoA ligase
LTHPSNLRALAIRSRERGCALPSLREARTFSERLPEDLRDQVQAAWGIPVSDLYSANEVGYVALQCPQSGLYHVQAEDVLVEVIGDDGRPCAAGESGRVIVTSLHNFAMPLLRYYLGDYATVGGPCPCGRTLPTLEGILGRTRNMMRLPGGRTAWPGFPMNTLVKLEAIRELKMIQHSLEEIEVQMVLRRPLTPDEETTLAEAVKARLRHPFQVRLTAVEKIADRAGHKREDFECRIA